MKKILLIEDNPDMRENTAEILELADYKVVTAENGKLGVAKAKKLLPDLIICDIMMPELDGYGVLYSLGKDPKTASIPFVFLTAKSERADFRKGMNLGADDYLTKPFEEMELFSVIEQRLKKSEILQKQFAKNIEGVSDFVNEARGLDAFQNLPERYDTRIFRKKDFLYKEGSYPLYLYFLNKGRIKTYKTNEDGKEFIINLYKEGDFFGYEALLKNVAYTETARAMEESEVVLMPKKDFFQLMHNNRDVANRFIQILSDSVLEKQEKLLHLAYDSVRKRVAEALLLLQARYQDEKGEKFRIAITREELASIVGTAKETLMRTLSDFRREGLITTKLSEITIVDAKGLEYV